MPVDVRSSHLGPGELVNGLAALYPCCQQRDRYQRISSIKQRMGTSDARTPQQGRFFGIQDVCISILLCSLQVARLALEHEHSQQQRSDADERPTIPYEGSNGRPPGALCLFIA